MKLDKINNNANTQDKEIELGEQDDSKSDCSSVKNEKVHKETFKNDNMPMPLSTKVMPDYNVPLPKPIEKPKEFVKQIIIHDYDF